MKLGLAVRELHRSENQLALDLLRMSERHRADHEVHHLARDLARWSQHHVAELADAGQRYDLRLSREPKDTAGLADRLRGTMGEAVGRFRNVELALLRDLRDIYLKASGVSVDWELLAQAAQGARDTDLLALAQRCHPDSLRQMRWANAKLKETATQALVS